MDPGWPTVRKIPLTLKRRGRGAEGLAAAWRHAAQADHEAGARAVCTQCANTYRRLGIQDSLHSLHRYSKYMSDCVLIACAQVLSPPPFAHTSPHGWGVCHHAPESLPESRPIRDNMSKAYQHTQNNDQRLNWSSAIWYETMNEV